MDGIVKGQPEATRLDQDSYVAALELLRPPPPLSFLDGGKQPGHDER